MQENKTAVYETPAVENGEISIDADTLTSNPMYINYDSNGTNIQLIAVKGSDGTPRLSLNTCQVCNPSPMAYFKEQNGRLVCQNCGNVFTIDSEYTDICITVPSRFNQTRLRSKGVIVRQEKQSAYQLGIADVETNYGNTVRTYNKERCICDIIKYRKKLRCNNFKPL